MTLLQSCEWLSENEGSFKPRILDGDRTGDETEKDSVRSYIQHEICAFLRVPPSTGKRQTSRHHFFLFLTPLAFSSSWSPCSSGHTERLPNPREAEKLARAILLCVDVERNRPGAEASHTLEALLSPLLETLSRVSTNIYLPVRKSDRSLQLVLQLLKLGETPNCPCQQGL